MDSLTLHLRHPDYGGQACIIHETKRAGRPRSQIDGIMNNAGKPTPICFMIGCAFAMFCRPLQGFGDFSIRLLGFHPTFVILTMVDKPVTPG